MPRKHVSASSRKKKVNTSPAVRTQVSTTSNSPNQQRVMPLSKSEQSTAAPISNESKASTTTPVTSEKTEKETFREWVYRQSKRWRGFLLVQLALAVPSAFLILLGFKDLPKTVLLFTILQQYPVGTPIIGLGLLVIALIPLVISFFPPRKGKDAGKSDTGWRVRILTIATVTSTLSFLVSSTLLTVVLLRPPWCSPPLCQHIPGPAGYHDANLEVSFQVFQGASYLIPEDPMLYTIAHLPEEKVGTQRIDQKLQPYRVVLNVHNLLQGQSSTLVINQVSLLVYKVAKPPNPLNVWNVGPSRSYDTNVYNVVYGGESVGEALPPGLYVRQPFGHVLLGPNETDALDIQVDSQKVVDLQFKIQITYRIFNESQSPMLTLPDVFEVVFSDGSNWHPWHLQSGHLVKG